MSTHRKIPCGLLFDPEWNDLSVRAQTVLIKLTLLANTQGQGWADLPLLAEAWHLTVSELQEVLSELVAASIITQHTEQGICTYQQERRDDWKHL